MRRARAALCEHRHADLRAGWEPLARLGGRRTGFGRALDRPRPQLHTGGRGQPANRCGSTPGPTNGRRSLSTRTGVIAVAYAIFKDSAFNGQVFYTRSDDGGLTFAPPRPITADPESQRFEAIAFDPDGALFAAWLDKRKRAAARARGEAYTGASLAFAWSKDGADDLLRRAHRQGQHLRMLPSRHRLCRRRPPGGVVPQYLRRIRARSRGDDLRRSDDAGPDLPGQRRRLGRSTSARTTAQASRSAATAPIT